ncbi:unnamed protein product [Orchesella dallaii]|uniref:Uncharacterized protein n=1 Tax=Orchesella dallaii TaxID=48710 RepID=A0ABP1PTM8_9HEXA
MEATEASPKEKNSTPFAIVSDKYTANRKTGQVVGFIAFINGKLQDIVVENAEVKQFSGDQLAELLQYSVNWLASDELIWKRFKNIPRHFMHRLNIDLKNRDLYSWEWDPAHMIERAMDDAQKGKSYKMLKKVNETVHHMEAVSEIQNVPITIAEHATNSTRSQGVAIKTETLNDVLFDIEKEVVSYVKTLRTGYKNMFNRYKPAVNDVIEKSFRLENLVGNAQKNIVPEEFNTYFKIASDSGYTDEALTEAAAGEQYLSMANFAKTEYANIIKIRPSRSEDIASLEMDIFANMLFSKHQQKIHIAADLSLKFENITKEMFISHYGPLPYAEGVDKLIVKAMNEHFRANTQSGKGHFYRKSRGDLLKHFTTSKVVDNKVQEATTKAKIKFN